MKNALYGGLLPHKAFLHYSSSILYHSLTPAGFTEAEKIFTNLEDMLKAEHIEYYFIGKVREANKLLKTMSQEFNEQSDIFSENYLNTLSKMRDILMKAQQEFENKYG